MALRIIKASNCFNPLQLLAFMRAIDGARTRGLDLGKVARYQLRHYRNNYLVRRFATDKIYYISFSSHCQLLFQIFQSSRNSSAFGFLLQASSHAKHFVVA